MFKFFKEIIGSIKEGVAEAKEEMAQEALEEKKATSGDATQNLMEISTISQTEKFGTALGAPFRTVIFGDWFSLFDKEKDDDLYPVYLYETGNPSVLDKRKVEFRQVLKRDFDIIDHQSSMSMLLEFFKLGTIDTTHTILEHSQDSAKLDIGKWHLSKPGANALLASVMSHIISASVDVGYLEKEHALNLFEKINAFTKTHYNNWTDFSNDFLIGEESIGLNNKVGRNMLSKYVNYLKNKKGSPWNNVEWTV